MDGGKEDPPGGKSLMDEIQALFAPPGGRDKRETKIVELHPYFKRPGKGHNHDCCDACGEGGNLICCDNCPSSFHLSCHAPPLDDEDIPKGDWVCLHCHYKEVSRSGTIARNQRDQMLTKPTTNTTTSQTPSNASPSSNQPPPEEDAVKKPSRPSRLAAKKASEAVTACSLSSSSASKGPKVQKLYRIKYDKYIQSRPETNSPFDALIAASRVVNAVEFSLPKNLEVSERLPFSWKWSDEVKEDLETYPKNCCVCQKTSRGVPSLSCDFCSSVYHLDCLDPPLCEIPKDTWMCPTHVEHFIDSNLLKSTSFSQRIKLWDKYARAPVDTDSIRVDFFRKINSGKRGSDRLIRSRARIPMSNRVRVPDLVKAQYKCPGSGFPREQSFTSFGPSRDGESDTNEWLAGVIALQSSFLASQEEVKIKDVKKEEKKNHLPKIHTKEKEGNESDETASNCSIDVDDEDADILTDEVRASLNEFISRRKSKLANLPPVVKEFLALQKAEELFKDYEMPPIHDIKSSVRPRACFTPLNVSKVPCPMKYRSMDIGFGKQNTLDLSKYGHCNYVSSLCATVFYDQYTRVFELMNYSEHGCIVDNAVYCVEPKKMPSGDTSLGRKYKYSSKIMALDPPFPSNKPCHCEMSISSYFRKNICSSSQTDAGDKKETLSALSDLNYNLSPSSYTHENSAVLNHGSYVRFGCLQFVFSIIDCDSSELNPASLKDEKGFGNATTIS